MNKLITFYNNKGGVSKTTTLFNLAVHLAQSGKKILIADCDPQCNATELFLASSAEFDDPDKPLPGTSIFEALRPRFEGEVARVDVTKVDLVASPIYKGLHLLRGDLEFASAEGYLANATNQAITENVHEKNTYLAIHRLLSGIALEHRFDYVLCDVGPSTGAITRMVVLASDGFFIPLTPDRFCSQAVRVLGRVLTEWIKRHEEISKTFEPFKLKPFPGKPCFLGAVIQNFKVHSGTSPKVSYQRWQEKINDGLKTSVLDNSKIPLRAGLDVKNPFIASTNLGDQIAFSWSRTTPIEAIRRRWSIYLQLAYLENLQWAWDALKLRSHRSFIILLLSNANGFEQIKLPIESTKKVEALYLVAASAAVGALWFTGWQWEPTLYGAWLLNHPDSPLNAEGS